MPGARGKDWKKWVPGQFKAGREYEIKRKYFADA